MGVGVALAAPIVPINIEIVRRGLSGGFVAGWLVGLGAVVADTIFCILVVTGAAPLADRPALRAPLYLLGAVVLLYLGLNGLRASAAQPLPSPAVSMHRRSFATGFLMAAGNPMGLVYWFSIGAALIAAAIEQAGAGAAPVLVAGVFSGIVLWVTLLSGLTRAGRPFVSPRVLRALNVAGALALAAFGIYFAWLGVSALS